MASAASLQFGQQLVTSSLPTALAQGSQLVVSPLSVWLALLLLFNGAGEPHYTHGQLLRHAASTATGCQRLSAPLTKKCASCASSPSRLTGPSTPTYNELWSVVAGNATQFTGDATPLEALNTQVAALRNALSRQASGGTLNLTIADALWTKGVSLNPAYAGDMQRLFKASVCKSKCAPKPQKLDCQWCTTCGLRRGWELQCGFSENGISQPADNLSATL